MSDASIRAQARREPWGERLQPWLAGLVSALLHLLMLLVLLHASPPTVTTPQGSASGGRMKVDLLGKTLPVKPAQPLPARANSPRSVRKSNGGSPLRSTLVAHADDPVAAEVADKLGTLAQDRRSISARPPKRSEKKTVPNPSRPSAASTAEAVPRRPDTWTGRPPGLLDEDVGEDANGQGRTASSSRGNRRDGNDVGPSLEVGGYQVYYQLYSQTRLRAWIADGMKELFIPLPGTRYYMVCPAQVALDRGSGKCRLLAADSPELKTIGDAREVINIMQVYRRGELLWRGPGVYR